MYRRQPLRQPNYDVPHLYVDLVHGVHYSLPLGCGAEDLGYMGTREEGKDAAARRDVNGVSIRKIGVCR